MLRALATASAEDPTGLGTMGAADPGERARPGWPWAKRTGAALTVAPVLARLVARGEIGRTTTLGPGTLLVLREAGRRRLAGEEGPQAEHEEGATQESVR